MDSVQMRCGSGGSGGFQKISAGKAVFFRHDVLLLLSVVSKNVNLQYPNILKK